MTPEGRAPVRRSTVVFAAVFAALATLAIVLVGISRLAAGPVRGPSGRQILTLHVEGSLPDRDRSAPLNELLGVRILTLPDMIGALDHAASDPGIAAIELKVGTLTTGWARAQELRDAILRFRRSGKPVHAFLEGADDGTYFLASAADRIRLVPTATVWLDGLTADVRFFGGTLEKIGVQADLEQIGAYKSAADVMKRSTMTEEHREATASLLQGLHGEVVASLAESLGRPAQEIEQLLASGPHAASAALDAGLVHALGYADEATADLDATVGRDLPRVSIEKYLRRVPAPEGRQTIAIVHCQGGIVSGESSDSLFGGEAMGSDTISRALRAARDEGASAIIMRVDSPGGSPTASDAIWRETMLAREAGVPVVVSMSDVAASGGYWISMGADAVIAEPTTITGSIGIFGGKYVTQGMDALLGMRVEAIESAPNAGLMSPRQPFTDAQRSWLRSELQSVYDLFIQRTAEGRGFASAAEVDAIGQGRVWTGRQALERGLVDGLGGMREALAQARELAGLAPDQAVTLKTYPRRPTFFEMLRAGGPSALAGELARTMAEGEASRLPAPLRAALDDGVLIRLLETGVVAFTPVRVRAR